MFVGLAVTARRNDRRAVGLENNCRAVKNLTKRKFLATVEGGLKSFEAVWYAEDALVSFYQCLVQ